jgi:ATP-dependent Lon protease
MTEMPSLDTQEELSRKIDRVFQELAIDKRRFAMSLLDKRGIPGYVGEWVLDSVVPGRGPLKKKETDEVHAWASRVIPGPDEQNVIKAKLLKGESLKVLTPVNVEIFLKRSRQERLARLSLLGIDDAHISDAVVDRFPDLLRQGMWGVTELVNTSEGVAVVSFKPMEASVNLGMFKDARREFTVTEWRSLMLLSMGYAPEAFKEEQQNLLLCRLLPLAQKSMHLIELAPKGTGKSYFFENISPKVRLISGGNVSPAVLFVNNASGQWGLLARYSVVVLDEVQTLKFEKPEEIVGGLKGFLANGRLTRGGLHETASDCGLVLLANIILDDKQRPLVDPLVQELPPFLRETAFLDRIKGIIPGWEVRKLAGECYATSLGLKADFFGDALLSLRNELVIDEMCKRRVKLKGGKPYQRNEESIRSLTSGFVKILFPHGEVSDSELYRYCLTPAIKLRQIVWDQIYASDAEYRQFEQELACDLV